jgi:hypothetical protein
MNLMKQILIGLALILNLLTTSFVQAQTKRLTPSDKEQIIKSILKRENFKDSETWAANSENTVYLLADNISPEQLPIITSIKFVLVTQNQVDEMAKAGVEYYRFGDFRVRNTLVRIFLVREYINVSGRHSNSSVMEYRCWKASGRWKVKGRLGAVGTGESN